MGQAALQAHCYAGRRRGAAAGGSGRQRHVQGAPAGVMLWAVPGVPLQCPTHPASLRDTAGGLWDRQRCKRIATQAAGGAPLQPQTKVAMRLLPSHPTPLCRQSTNGWLNCPNHYPSSFLFPGGGNSQEPRPCQLSFVFFSCALPRFPRPPPPAWCTQRSHGCTRDLPCQAPPPNPAGVSRQLADASLCSHRLFARLLACSLVCQHAAALPVALRAPLSPRVWPALPSFSPTPPPPSGRLEPVLFNITHLRNARGAMSSQHAYHAALHISGKFSHFVLSNPQTPCSQTPKLI